MRPRKSRRRAVALVLAFQIPLVAIIAAGSATGHMVLAIFVAVGLLFLGAVRTHRADKKPRADAQPDGELCTS